MAYKDIENQRKYARQHYKLNKKTYKKRAYEAKKRAYKRNMIFLIEYLKQHPCIECNEKDMVVLEFDHRKNSNKIREVSKMAANGVSIETLKKEITKCDIRCANCHRRITAKRRGFYKYI